VGLGFYCLPYDHQFEILMKPQHVVDGRRAHQYINQPLFLLQLEKLRRCGVTKIGIDERDLQPSGRG
jgi:hypothetical protein